MTKVLKFAGEEASKLFAKKRLMKGFLAKKLKISFQ